MEERLLECLRVALMYQVSDIHFNLCDDSLSIEMRINGQIKRLKQNEDDQKLFRYIQYRANIDMGKMTTPQTGRFELMVDDKLVSLRFAIINSFHMSSGVLRILNNFKNITSEDLSDNPSDINYMRSIFNHRDGLFLFTGPTGSGKSTSLYTLLNEVKQKKIYTLEDPIEVYSNNFVQLQINERQHLGYDEGIKQLMRHDPDIIMIGEIRDSIAAKMAVRCALTGHLVVSSMHASSCIGAIDRLKELEVNPTQLKDVLKGVLNQRLYVRDGKQGKVGVYEIFNQENITRFFEAKPPDYISLQTKIEDAVKFHQIKAEEARQDLVK